MADEFFKTIMGRRFYDGTMPSIATSLKRIADALDEDEQRQAGVRLAKAEAAEPYVSRDAFPLTVAEKTDLSAHISVAEIDLAMDELARQGQGTALDRPYAILAVARRLVAK